jgi:alcohol dehydrogenase class IV
LARYSVEAPDIATNVKQPTVSLITIPTSLSGGEYFSLAGGTDDFVTQHKQAFIQSGMGSKLVILDPELSVHTPEYYWLSTGVRSIDHCVEALAALDATELSDKYAEQGLKLLVPNLLKSKLDPDDLDARMQCQLGVRLAMANVRAGIPLGGSHAIGHQLGTNQCFKDVAGYTCHN